VRRRRDAPEAIAYKWVRILKSPRPGRSRRLPVPHRQQLRMCEIADVKPNHATKTELIGVLERFCSAFADRKAEAVMDLFAPDGDVVVVTSKEPLLRGAAELQGFLDR
jgi:hypothetical protein